MADAFGKAPQASEPDRRITEKGSRNEHHRTHRKQSWNGTCQVLKRAEQALQTEKPTEAFTDRITNALDQVADAQSKSASLAKVMKWASK